MMDVILQWITNLYSTSNLLEGEGGIQCRTDFRSHTFANQMKCSCKNRLVKPSRVKVKINWKPTPSTQPESSATDLHASKNVWVVWATIAVNSKLVDTAPVVTRSVHLLACQVSRGNGHAILRTAYDEIESDTSENLAYVLTYTAQKTICGGSWIL